MIDGRANELSDLQVFRTALKYCLLVIGIPVISFFSVKTLIFDGLFKLEQVTSSVYSAVVAVLALHMALALYIYRAYYVAERDSGYIKQD